MVVKAGYFLHQPQAHTLKLILGVGCGLGFASLPLWFKEVRKREQGVAQMRDAQYAESKDDARAARLSPNAGKNAANAK
eukprot:CAMPEP_0181368708 /NCGR_PEP_ID=MMETSP1106-20121128/12278_1 /TAXON_ID=81844 /ORGANISM="Mantoniella antarctica, Strain SL-175" /LENGTH=78 /DNA_ID=CAMNT_0023484935 /DNA_START=54 /DNA_END=290 /DNA_ORIENTATION=+